MSAPTPKQVRAVLERYEKVDTAFRIVGCDHGRMASDLAAAEERVEDLDEAFVVLNEIRMEREAELQRLRTLADDEAAVERAAKEILQHATFPTLTRWELIGSSGQRRYRIAAQAALRAALGGAP